jgi:hypothetical protein
VKEVCRYALRLVDFYRRLLGTGATNSKHSMEMPSSLSPSATPWSGGRRYGLSIEPTRSSTAKRRSFLLLI